MKNALFMVLMVLALPLILLASPFIMLFVALDNRKVRMIIFNSNCLNCGVKLNGKSIELADDLNRKSLSILRSRRTYRIVRTLYAVCALCGQKHGIKKRGKEIIVIKLPAG